MTSSLHTGGCHVRIYALRYHLNNGEHFFFKDSQGQGLKVFHILT
jgi:hypothetical protein